MLKKCVAENRDQEEIKKTKVRKCVEENRDRGEIKKAKGEEYVAEKKTEKREKVNCKLYLQIVGLFEFYIQKFQKFDFTH